MPTTFADLGPVTFAEANITTAAGRIDDRTIRISIHER